MPLFDAYVAVDWSAANRRKTDKDSIWIAACGSAGDVLRNTPTRDEATLAVRDLLLTLTSRGERVLVGFDFPYGYPRGFADRIAPGAGAPWRRTWDALAVRVEDDARNRSNRFAVAADLNAHVRTFWGCPSSFASSLAATKDRSDELREYREVERRLQARGRSAKSAWQLFGRGCVGSQALLGIPRVRALRDDSQLAAHSAVWPCETGLRVPEAQVVHAEIWPGALDVDPTAHAVADAAQVLSVVRAWAHRDARGELAPLFEPPVDDVETRVAIEEEEGWILGAAA